MADQESTGAMTNPVAGCYAMAYNSSVGERVCGSAVGALAASDVLRRALAGGRWRAPDLSERQARGCDTGAEPVYFASGAMHVMAGEPSVIWCDGSKTPAHEVAHPAGGWEPIGDDVVPVEPPPPGTKRWLEALAQRHTGVAAMARNARPGVVLIELAGEPSVYDVDMFLSAATLSTRASIEVTWTKTVDGPVRA